MRRKIFCIGFNKTGTTTLHTIFKEQLGLKSTHKGRWTYWSADKQKSRIDKRDCFTDGETALVRRLKEKYPDAYFILNTRPLRSWLISRHKSTERTKAAAAWFLKKFMPLEFLANWMKKYYLRNDERAMMTWIKIRNSYHRYVLDEFSGDSKFLMVDIESETMTDQLSEFLGLNTPIEPVWKNIEGSADGTGSIASRIVFAIGDKKTKVSSEERVDEFLHKHGLAEHGGCLTYIDEPKLFLSASFADRITKFLPFSKRVYRSSFLWFVHKRGAAKNFVSKWFWDVLISMTRSNKD
ncbi:MAG: sulfotransferase, partial [Cyclobacteriaceae bacterium]